MAELGSRLLLWSMLGTGLALLLVASFRDVALRSLPNWTSLGLAGVGGVLRVRDGTLPIGLAVALGVFGVAYLCWRRGWLGGGDVKLLAACSLLVAPVQAVNLIVLTTLGGGVLAIFYLALGLLLARSPGRAAAFVRPGHARPGMLRRLWRLECRRIRRRAPLPYGCAIAGATLVTLFGAAGPIGR